MTKWKKASEAQQARFQAAIPDGAEPRKMFGYPCCFVNGNMVSGLHQDDWIVRLPEPQRKELMAAGGTTFEPMPGRPMREYVTLPPAVLADPKAVGKWMQRALKYGESLPAKAKKPAKKKPAAKPTR